MSLAVCNRRKVTVNSYSLFIQSTTGRFGPKDQDRKSKTDVFQRDVRPYIIRGEIDSVLGFFVLFLDCKYDSRAPLAYQQMCSELLYSKINYSNSWGEKVKTPASFDLSWYQSPLWVIYQLNGFLNPYSKVHYSD